MDNTTTFESNDTTNVVNVPTVPQRGVPYTTKEMESLRRYQDLWLPFVAEKVSTVSSNHNHNKKNKNTPHQHPPLPPQLIPPPDIAWLWHCHRLAPQEYIQYCEIFFPSDHKMIRANPPFTFVPRNGTVDHEETSKECNNSESATMAETKRLWNETYPNESFFLNEVDATTTVVATTTTTTTTTGSSSTSPTLNGYDVLGSARRQMAFLWQVSGDQYTCDSFLQQGVTNYTKFLTLTSKANDLGIILVPTYQIDLMWHTHILSSIHDYNNDCFHIMKRHLYHDDSLTDREEGGILDVSFDATQQLWKRVYGVDYVVHGGMYRGEPPVTYYTPTWLNSNADTTASTSQSAYGHTLIGKVGASSTPSNVVSSMSPKPWVSLDGIASDGRPAFIRTEEQTKDLIKDFAYRDPYVLCRLNRKTGYYHIETKEAQKILFYRMSDRLYVLKNEMMMETCTCGLMSRKNRATPARVEYNQLKLVCDSLEKQLFVAGTSTGNTIPSETMFTCAGGACGGAVAIKGSSHYAAACGTVLTTYAGEKLGFSPI